MCRDVVGSDTVLSSDEELETESSAVEHGNVALTGAGSALHGKDKCRKTLKLSSEQLVSCFAVPPTWLLPVSVIVSVVSCTSNSSSGHYTGQPASAGTSS